MPSKQRIVPGRQNAIELTAGVDPTAIKSVVLKYRRGADNKTIVGDITPLNRDAAEGSDRQITLPTWTQSSNGTTTLRILVPTFDAIEKPLGFDRQWTSANDLALSVNCGRGEGACTNYPVEVPEPAVAWWWALGTVAAVWIIFGTIWASRSGWTRDIGWRVLRFPLAISETEFRRYSLSVFQSVIWTFVLVFGLPFVWKITSQFLVVTPQVLMLLGIGSGTAVLSGINTRSRLQPIDVKYRDLLKQDGPKLSDLISLDGAPSIARIQMLAFTFIIADSVWKSIYDQYEFPVLSDGLVALMGISSAVYVGGNVVSAVPEERVKKAIADYEANTKGLDKGDAEIENQKKALRDVLVAYVT
jgi:hypothetical protein